jgi:hypothetical protein
MSNLVRCDSCGQLFQGPDAESEMGHVVMWPDDRWFRFHLCQTCSRQMEADLREALRNAGTDNLDFEVRAPDGEDAKDDEIEEVEDEQARPAPGRTL